MLRSPTLEAALVNRCRFGRTIKISRRYVCPIETLICDVACPNFVDGANSILGSGCHFVRCFWSSFNASGGWVPINKWSGFASLASTRSPAPSSASTYGFDLFWWQHTATVHGEADDAVVEPALECTPPHMRMISGFKMVEASTWLGSSMMVLGYDIHYEGESVLHCEIVLRPQRAATRGHLSEQVWLLPARQRPGSSMRAGRETRSS